MSDITVSQHEVKRLSLKPLITLIGIIIILIVFSLMGCQEGEEEIPPQIPLQIPPQIPQRAGTVKEYGVTYDLMRYPNPDGTFSTYKTPTREEFFLFHEKHNGFTDNKGGQ